MQYFDEERDFDFDEMDEPTAEKSQSKKVIRYNGKTYGSTVDLLKDQSIDKPRCCPSSLAPAEEPEEKMCDTIDLLSDIFGEPRMTEEEKAAYIERSERRMEELRRLEQENQEWQSFRRKYVEKAEIKAHEDWDRMKSGKHKSTEEKLHDMLHRETGIEDTRKTEVSEISQDEMISRIVDRIIQEKTAGQRSRVHRNLNKGKDNK